MANYKDRARRYHEAIRSILLKEWDPIGIADVPQAQDEYDSYVPEIYAMLISHSDKYKLMEHLWSIETVAMGLCGNRARTESIVARLCEVREDMERSSRT